jgi:hypothetical protein
MTKTPWADKAAIPEVPTAPAPASKAAPAKGEEKPKMPPPRVFAIGELETPPKDDPNELIRHRYLCRGSGMLVVGPTGVGKSTFTLQAALCWAVGREHFGLVPARPLRSLIIQSENDHGDLAEMRDGIYAGLNFTERERREANERVLVAREDCRTAAEFCDEVIAPLLEEHQIDILWIDPALAYIGGEANSQKDVGGFLRNHLNPLVHKHNCAVIVVHHTNKPPSGSEKPDWSGSDFAYLGSGSAEWSNWPRAILAMRSLGSHDIYELRAGKRGGRLRWQDEQGERIYSKLIAHAKQDGFCWREATRAELELERGGSSEVRIRRYKPSLDEFMALFPPSFRNEPREALLSADQIKNAFHERGWHKDFYKGLCDEAESTGKLKTTAAGRYNQLLRGLPGHVEAFETKLAEAGSMMAQVPLAAPSITRAKRGRKR